MASTDVGEDDPPLHKVSVQINELQFLRPEHGVQLRHRNFAIVSAAVHHGEEPIRISFVLELLHDDDKSLSSQGQSPLALSERLVEFLLVAIIPLFDEVFVVLQLFGSRLPVLRGQLQRFLEVGDRP